MAILAEKWSEADILLTYLPVRALRCYCVVNMSVLRIGTMPYVP